MSVPNVPPPAPSASTHVVSAAPKPPKSSVGSKLASIDTQTARSTGSTSSKKSSKKSSSKKSDLSSWESSCERVLNKLQKIEHVAKLHFDQPLVEVFPQLMTEYNRLISEPMDLRTLREQLLAHALTTPEFIRKGRLIFQNAIRFNCADDPASVHVREMSSHLLWYFDSLCAEHHLVTGSTDGGSSSPRSVLRKERAEVVKAVPVEVKAKECLRLLRVLNSQKYDKNCWPFRKPVKVLFPALSTEYFTIIKNPMDLATISEKVTNASYSTHGDFIRDVRLTFENAMIYNRADKEREGWSVYAAAVHMLAIVEDLWGDVTLEVMEKIRRRDLLRKERDRLYDQKKREHLKHGGERDPATVKQGKVSSSHSKSESATEKDRVTAVAGAASATSSSALSKKSSSASITVSASSLAAAVAAVANRDGSGATSATSSAAAASGDASATRVKLQVVNRTNMDRMNKSERKAEEKRRKRARREEELARSEKRRRTAVAATDEALREAEVRSRRKLQKQEIAQAMALREERDRKTNEAEAEKARVAQMKFNAAAWTGVLVPATQKSAGFWSKKRVKLQVPAAFQAAISSF